MGGVLLVRWYERQRLWIVDVGSCEKEVWWLQQGIRSLWAF